MMGQKVSISLERVDTLKISLCEKAALMQAEADELKLDPLFVWLGGEDDKGEPAHLWQHNIS